MFGKFHISIEICNHGSRIFLCLLSGGFSFDHGKGHKQNNVKFRNSFNIKFSTIVVPTHPILQLIKMVDSKW